MKICFAMLNPGYARAYESTLRLLAQRGHAVHLAFSQPEKDADGLAERLASEYAGISCGPAPKRGDFWAGVAWAVRISADYLRYLHPRYRRAVKLRRRARAWPGAFFLRRLHLLPIRGAAMVGFLTRCLAALERAIPSSRLIEECLRGGGFELVLVTPLVNMGSTQVDYVKSARAVGLPTGLCVASWDNLTNKGLVRVIPDLVIVWNEAQRREAVELHGVPPARVVVTGAQRFDEWFGRESTTARAAFCDRVGLRADRPYLLYVCSSPFIAPHEAPFVERWLGRLRAGPETLRDVGVLVRPHPQNAAQWRGVDLSSWENVAVWPPTGANPVDRASKTDYFDSLYHSAAVVGINTSALIEAGIVGRSVHTLLTPEYADTQRGTLHFAYLAAPDGGLLRVARTWEEHLGQLEASILEGATVTDANRRFLAAFVRPRGLDVPSTPIVVEAIEALGRKERQKPEQAPVWSYPLRLALLPLAILTTRLWGRNRRAA
ncbi:MAG: hypothetical protein H0V51_15635 [Chloroflexi bacterium]|nr:hypothetical protein [Chloroflexota bacterium]